MLRSPPCPGCRTLPRPPSCGPCLVIQPSTDSRRLISRVGGSTWCPSSSLICYYLTKATVLTGCQEQFCGIEEGKAKEEEGRKEGEEAEEEIATETRVEAEGRRRINN